ncbi:MAG: peroxiredoxin [Bacteroidales bacterium]|nr:peroxiredoxin [Bacteroidales bacterium]MCF8333789.1 peroxiredoxin [Bacteroidales bacterium]
MEEQQGLPLLGDMFPQMEVNTTHGPKKIPDDYKGKWLVLFSHPGDFTPVCTTEFVAFANRKKQFDDLNTELLGLSVDQVFSHIKWTEWIKEKLGVEIPFPIIGDEMGRVAKKMGMIAPEKGTNTVRAVFIIDPQGKIRISIYYPQEIGRQVDEVLRALKALQTHEKEKVALPENWPNNELINDHGIIPPASTEEKAAERRGQDNCYDWWFCHKALK